MLLNRNYTHGGDIYGNDVELDFSSNTNPFGMPPEVRAALGAAVGDCAVYPDPYCRELRRAIASAEGVEPDAVLCGNGAAELIFSYALALGDDRPALIVSPTFSGYRTALDAAGVRCDEYLTAERDGFALTDDILKEDLSRYSAVFICTPNNPTGLTVDPEILRAVAETGVRLFVDMCYIDLSDGGDIYDIPRLLTRYPNATVLKAFTKSCAMAGVRLGYAVSGDGAFLEKMSSKTQCWNVSTLAQRAGVAAACCGGWVKEAASYIAAERGRLTSELSSPGLRVYPSRANFLLIYSDADLYGRLLKKRILVRDCSTFSGLKKGYIRVAVRTREENERLSAAIKEVIR